MRTTRKSNRWQRFCARGSTKRWQRTKIRFPVYLVFTNADSIEGFRDSFSTSKEKEKIWSGVRPFRSKKATTRRRLFDSEYETSAQFGDETPSDASVARRFRRFVSFGFSISRFISVRLGAKSARLSRRCFARIRLAKVRFCAVFILRRRPSAVSRVKADETMPPNMPQTIGNTYFTEKFFRDVVLRDKDLVQTFQQQKQRPPILGWVLTVLGAFLVSRVADDGRSFALQQQGNARRSRSTKGEAVLTIVESDDGQKSADKKSAGNRAEINATEDLRAANGRSSTITTATARRSMMRFRTLFGQSHL